MKPNSIVFSWAAPQFFPKNRTADWYWIIGFLTLVAVVLPVIFKNYLLAIVFLISGITLMVLQGKHPGLAQVEINQLGIKVNGNIHRYETLESFWMFQDETGRTRILLHIARPFIPYFSIPIDPTINADAVRSFLVTRIKEVEHKEPTTELLIRTFGL